MSVNLCKPLLLTKQILRLWDKCVAPKNIFMHQKSSNFSLKNATDPYNLYKCVAPMRPFCMQKDAIPNQTENSKIDLAAITKGDPELEKKYKVLLLELDVCRQEGNSVPSESFMTTEHWQEVMTMKSRSKRMKFYKYLLVKEVRKQRNKEKRRKHRFTERPDIKEKLETDDGHIKYGLGYNTIYIRIYDSTINQLYNNNLVQAMKFGQKLVVDCGYDDHMVKQESKNCAKQLMLLFSENRIHKEPYDVHYCNVNPEKITIKELHKHIPTMCEPWFPMNLHKESYLDLFPRNELVYLTPHCREELTEYDHNAIYIIGGMVDKINTQPLSLAKAKKEGLKMAKLPLDRYLQWGAGSGKSLTLDQMISILLDIKETGDWNHALRHVPRRKIIQPGEEPRHNLRKLPFMRMKYSDRGFDKDDKELRNLRFGGKIKKYGQ